MKRVKENIRIPVALLGLSAIVVATSGSGFAAILQEATGTTVGAAQYGLVGMVNKLLTQALIITVIIAPLAMAYGAGSLMFSTRGGGGQIIGASIVAIVLVAAMKTIAA